MSASQTKISMGLKRKAEFSEGIETIDKKIKEMRNKTSIKFYLQRKYFKQNSVVGILSNFVAI